MITAELFRKECLSFRKVMCDKRNTLSAIDWAFGCLFFAANNVAPPNETCDHHWTALTAEWLRRKELMMLTGHPLGTEDDRPVLD